MPARNCADVLPGYLKSVGRFADAVVALDDGSTDATREVLEAHPLVRVVLARPQREGFAGWDDAANRAALLAAAAELEPQWVLSLDADERLNAQDGAALREFVERDALPGFAYGFRVFRMLDGLAHYDRAELWVYRLFAFRRGQRFPAARLHFVPVPTSIPRSRWLKTTLRIERLTGAPRVREADGSTPAEQPRVPVLTGTRYEPGDDAAAAAGRDMRRLIEVNAYVHPPGDGTDGVGLGEVCEQLTYLSVFSCSVRRDGFLTPVRDEVVRRAAQAAGVRPFLVLTNTEAGRFDLELGQAVLRSTPLQERVLANVLVLLRDRGFAGLNVDFEHLRPEDRQAYNAFLALAARHLRERGFGLSTAVAPRLPGDEDSLWHAAHDYAAHGALADFVVLMTYEWGRAAGPPQPIAPEPSVRAVVSHAVEQMPAEKILLGIPLYAYDWTLPHRPGISRAAGISHDTAAGIAARHGASIEYHERVKAPSFRYVDDGGRHHLVWFEDSRSLQAKFDLVEAFGLRGLSYWALPLACAENWALLERNFRVRKTRRPARP